MTSSSFKLLILSQSASLPAPGLIRSHIMSHNQRVPAFKYMHPSRRNTCILLAQCMHTCLNTASLASPLRGDEGVIHHCHSRIVVSWKSQQRADDTISTVSIAISLCLLTRSPWLGYRADERRQSFIKLLWG